MASTVLWCGDDFPASKSARVFRATREAAQSSDCDQPSKARAARHCSGVKMPFCIILLILS